MKLNAQSYDSYNLQVWLKCEYVNFVWKKKINRCTYYS